MQFFALMRRRTEAFSDAQFAPLMESEALRVRELYAEGIVRQAWSRGDQPGAVLLLETFDEADATAALESLPLCQAGMLETETLTRVMPYRGFVP